MKFILLAVSAWLLSAAQTRAAFDCFLKLTGVPGESINSTHRDEIDVESFSVGLVGGTQSSAGGGGATGPAQFGSLSITKLLDKASPLLMLRCASGTLIAEAVLTCRRPASAGSILLYKITLRDVFVSSVSTGGSEGGNIAESVSFTYGQIRWEYTPQLPTGGTGTPITAGWDVKANRAL